VSSGLAASRLVKGGLAQLARNGLGASRLGNGLAASRLVNGLAASPLVNL
jgi:hypothetical protein